MSNANRQNSLSTVKKRWEMYILLIPGVLFILLFKYVPMYGVVIAFKDFNIFKGVFASQWVGFDNFIRLFHSDQFFQVFFNTLIISFYKMVFIFPLPIFIALLLNEVRLVLFKRTVQTIVSLPHFLSWAIIAGIFIDILSPYGGMVNNLINALGGSSIGFMTSEKWFRSIVVFSSGWKEAGWQSIIFLAAIAGIGQEQYESAKIDGAGRVRQMLHITVPNIASTIILMFIMRLGHVLEAGFTQILVMYNPTVYGVGDVIETYVYRMGIGKMDYSYSTAVGLFQSVVGFTLVISGNWLSKKITQKSIW